TKFYNESHKDQPLPDSTPVLASGSYFNEGSMVERLQRLTPYPVRLPDPPLRYGSDFPMPQYAVNLGLALKEL
ncbi:MAG: pilus assembly protein, partial [Anaerolineales bacterium]